MAEETLTALPPGFVLDSLPQGFVVDGQRPEPDHSAANKALAKTATGIVERAKETAKDIGTLYGPAEMALNAASGFLFGFPAYLGGGVGTLAARAMGIGDPDEDPQHVGERFAQAVTYQPMSAAGRRLSEELLLPLSDLTAAGKTAGRKVTDVTGSPHAGALTESTITMLPAFVLGSLGRKVDGKLPTRESIDEAATAITGTTDPAVVAHVADKLQAIYERTGIDPPAVFKSNRTNATVLQDLASSNIEVPGAIKEALPPERPPAPPAEPAAPVEEKPVGYWQGPGGSTDIEPTFEKPSMAERLTEALREDRHWYAADEGTSAKEILAQGRAGMEAGKTPEAALGEALPPPPPAPPKPVAGEPPRSAAEQAILSKIVPEGEPFYVTLKNLLTDPQRTLSKLRTEGIDRLNPIKTEERRAGGPARFAEGVGPYEAQRLTAGVFGKASVFLEYGTRRFGNWTQKTGPSLFEVLDSVKDDPRGFEAYIVAKHAIEVEARGLKSGFDLEAARQVVADGAGKFEKAAQGWNRFGDAMLDYVVDAGLVSDKSAAAMREAYSYHVPFYRAFEEQSRPVSGQPRSPIKRMVGSERPVIDPIVSKIKDTFLFVALAEKNAARLKMVELGPEYAKPVKAATRPIDITDEVSRALKARGIDLNDEAFTAFRPQSYVVAADQIVVFEGGKRRIYEVDPEVARAFNAADSGSASLLASMLRSSASLLRAGVTLAPEFSPRNLFRDAVASFVYAGSHPIKTAKGAMSLWGHDEAFQRWMAGGGANAAMVSMDRAYINQEIFRLHEQTGFMNATWNTIKTPIEALRIASEFMENMTRLGSVRDEMLAAKTGAKIQALSLISREATVDFAVHGADPFLQNWLSTTAFMNPQIQGIDLMFRKIAENPKGTTARAFAAITIPSLYLWWANHDDVRWKDIPNWERDLFWIIMEGHATKERFDAMTPKEQQAFMAGSVYRLPKAFELGVLFGSVPERILDAYVDEKPDAFKGMGKTMLNVFGFSVIPTVGVPPLEHLTNYSIFTDKPLIPHSMENWLPEYQFTPYTTQLTRALGHVIGQLPSMHDSSFASPLVIDNYIRGWSGTLGTYAVQVADLALRKTGALPDPTRPASALADIPGVKAFVVRYPAASAQSIRDFYDSYAQETKVIATVRHLAQQGDTAAALREAQLDPAALVRLEGIHKGLSNAQNVIQMIDKNPSIPADEKRQLIDATYFQMIQMASAGNAAIQQIRQAVKPQPPVVAPAPETIQ